MISCRNLPFAGWLNLIGQVAATSGTFYTFATIVTEARCNVLPCYNLRVWLLPILHRHVLPYNACTDALACTLIRLQMILMLHPGGAEMATSPRAMLLYYSSAIVASGLINSCKIKCESAWHHRG